MHLRHILPFCLWTLLVSAGPAAALQDLGSVLQKADALLDQAKAAYDEARTSRSVAMFVDAGFKLEEARIKYLVLQEIGSSDQQKTAGERLRAVAQLLKLVNDGKVAVHSPPVPEPPAPDKTPPADPAAKPEPAAPPQAPPIDVMKRHQVPDAKSQKDAEKLIRDLLKAEYAKKAVADRRALARLLLEHAAKNRNDAATLWVLCREAQDIAVQSCDVKASIDAVEVAAAAFDVDPLPMKVAALTAAAKAAKTPEDFEQLAAVHLDLVDEFVGSDQYDLAEKAAAAAVQFARRTPFIPLVNRSSARAKEVAEAKTLYQAMRGVMETLAKSSDDPGGNLEMGKFLCFVKGSWDLGLRFLVKGSDVAMKALAEKELALSLQVADRIAVADGWYDLFEQEKSPLCKSQLLAHARWLYEAVLADAPSLQRLRIERRLAALPRGDGSGVNLLSLIDPLKDKISGLWKATSKGLSSPRMMDSLLQVPYVPPDEYDLEVVAEWQEGEDGLGIGLARGKAQVMMVIGSWGQTVSGLRLVDGVFENENPTSHKGPVFTKGKPARIVCSVRRTSIDVTVDGRKIVSWKADYSKFSLGHWAVPRKDALFLCSLNNVYEITRMSLTPVSGQGKKIR